MSSLFPGPGTRGPSASGPASDVFNARVRSRGRSDYEAIDDLSPAARIQTAGGSTGQERLAQQQPRFDTAMQAADTYDLRTEQSTGIVGSIFDFLGRGQSAITGALTGYTGMERNAENRGYGSFTEAARRFREGASGKEQYRFSQFTDTGRRVAEGEDVSGLQRGWNTALGFAIDTALDPLTYVSFGGSIMGRMRAANAIRSGPQTAIRDAIRQDGFNTKRFVRTLVDPSENVYRTSTVASRLNTLAKGVAEGADPAIAPIVKGFNVSPTSSFDEIIAATDRLQLETGIDLLREFAVEAAPEAAGMAYARRSAAGLRQWSIRNFGDEAGNAYFNSLPTDIQGGIRIRLPFIRRADGTPIAAGIKGVGAGRLSEKFAPLGKLSELTQEGRDIARVLLERPLRSFSGEGADLYYDAVIKATGKVKSNRQSSWVDYSGAKYAQAERRSMRAIFDNDMLRRHETASQIYEAAVSQYGDVFKNSFRNFMYNTEELTKAGTRDLTGHEAVAYRTAVTWRSMLDELGEQAVEIFGDADIAFNRIRNYVPRAATQIERASRFLGRKSSRGGSGAFDYTKHRGQWAEQWKIFDDGIARVVKWMPNEDIKRVGGQAGDVFESDPTVWMSIYLTELRTSLIDQKTINFYKNAGLLTSAERATMNKVDQAEAQRRIYELIGSQADPAGTPTPTLRRIEDRLTSPAMAYTGDDNWQQAEALASYLRSEGLDILEIGDINQYVKDGEVFRNVIDNTGILRTKSGRYQIVDSQNRALRHSDGRLREYDSYDEARGAWNVDQRVTREGIYYEEYLPDVRAGLLHDIDAIYASPIFADLHLNNLARMQNDDEIALYIEAWMIALQRFGRYDPETVVTKGGQPAFARGPGNMPKGLSPLEAEVSVMEDSFKQWLQSNEYMSIGGLTFNPDETLSEASRKLVKTRIAEQLVNEYAPQKLMENIQRIYKVQQDPQGVGAAIYNNLYKPLYAAQKAWMTLGRGPGFVARNILGGSWNNWINGVGREHSIKSARMLAARKAADKQAKKMLQGNILEIDPQLMADTYRDTVRKNLSSNYKGAELDELMEYWDLFSRQGLAGNRDTARLYGELFQSVSGRGARNTQRFKGSSRASRLRIKESGTVDQPLTVYESQGMERFLEVVGGDNWWIKDFMAPKVEMSEDYMRFAAFLKGIDEIGLEAPQSGIRGFAAGEWVKVTQFDYADLSDAERTMKMVVPFYTWTRYNVPLQVRAVIQQPGRIAQALRIHESLGEMFGEEDAVSPSYVADKFGITIGEHSPFFAMLPKGMRPKGDVTLGLTWGEPIGDINTLFRDPTRSSGINKFLNMREVAQQLNPIITASSEIQRAFTESGRAGVSNVEEAPRWAQWLQLSSEDPLEPGREVASRSVLEGIRNILPMVGQAERLFPYIGGERSGGRWTTSIISAMFGLPVATIDDWKKASEMDLRTNFINNQMKDLYGREWEYRMETIRRLQSEGAPTEFIEAMNLREIKDTELDVLRAVHTWRMMRRVELLLENGTTEDEVLAALSAFVPEGSKTENILQILWDYAPKPSSDFSEGVRQYGLQPVSRQDLEDLGLTRNDVRNMTEDEQKSLIYWVNRNRGWTGPRT